MERWTSRIAMVTGASKSLGLAITEALVNYGMVVLAVDDDGEDFLKLEQLMETLKTAGASGELMPMRCDLRSIDNVKKLFGSIKSDPDIEGIDVCIYCASLTLGESVLDGNPEVWKSMLECNILAPAMVTQEAYKSMKERDVDDGHVIYISSLIGHRVMPGNKALNFLAITKHGVRALLEGVRNELRMQNSQIRVSALSPGVIETDIIKKLFEDDFDGAQSYLSEKKYLTNEDIVSAVTFALEQPPHVQIHDILMRSTDQIP